MSVNSQILHSITYMPYSRLLLNSLSLLIAEQTRSKVSIR